MKLKNGQDVLDEFIRKAVNPDYDLISVSADVDCASNIHKYSFEIANHEDKGN